MLSKSVCRLPSRGLPTYWFFSSMYSMCTHGVSRGWNLQRANVVLFPVRWDGSHGGLHPEVGHRYPQRGKLHRSAGSALLTSAVSIQSPCVLSHMADSQTHRTRTGILLKNESKNNMQSLYSSQFPQLHKIQLLVVHRLIFYTAVCSKTHFTLYILSFDRKCWFIWKTRRTWAFSRVWLASCSHAGNWENSLLHHRLWLKSAQQTWTLNATIYQVFCRNVRLPWLSSFVPVFWILMLLRGRTKPRGWGWWRRKGQVSFTVTLTCALFMSNNHISGILSSHHFYP